MPLSHDRQQAITPGLIADIWRLDDANYRPSLIAERLRVAKSVIERVLTEPRPAPVRRGDPDLFPCGHDRKPANMAGRKGRESCRSCKRQRDRERRRNIAPARRPETPKPVNVREFAPRPLPVVDTSARSYSLAPSRDRRSA